VILGMFFYVILLIVGILAGICMISGKILRPWVGFFYDFADCGNFGQDLHDFGQDFVILDGLVDVILVIVVILARIGMISNRIL